MKQLLLLIAAATILSSCAHSFMRGTVAMKVDDRTAHVCLGDDSVKKGDKIRFYTNECIEGEGKDDGGGTRSCRLETIGEGIVSKTLNSHYSLVKTSKKFSFREGTLVQKIK